jgi:hypothetical protein
LENDDAYRERRERLAKTQAANAARYREEIEPVVQALRAIGVPAENVRASRLRELQAYPSAVPVLLEHLAKPYSQTILWSLANALAVPEARSAWPDLVAAYKSTPTPAAGSPEDGMGLKDGLANALAATVSKDTISTLIALAKDPSHGNSRLLLLQGIRRSRDPRAKLAIEELSTDPQLAKEIASWRRPKPRAH